MTARVMTVRRRSHHAWCETCQDGVNGTKAMARQWAEMHNHAHHGVHQRGDCPASKTTPAGVLLYCEKALGHGNYHARGQWGWTDNLDNLLKEMAPDEQHGN